MTSYRRNFVAGGSYFFTANLADRRARSTHRSYRLAALGVPRHERQDIRFTIDAIVVLPDHLHAIWTLPDADQDFATRWRLIKSAFSRALPKTEAVSESRARKAERGIWQRRYWEHTLRDERDFGAVDYIHFNPIKHGT